MATNAPRRRPALLPDLERSRAVVVACDHDDVRPPEVQATADAEKLAEALTRPEIGPPFLPEHLTLLTSWKHPDEIVDAVRRAAGEASDVLFLHYTGTGRRHDDVVFPRGAGDRGERPSPLLTAIGIVRDSRAARRVLSLDCEGHGTAWGWLDDHPGEDASRTTGTLSLMGKGPTMYFGFGDGRIPAGDSYTLALDGALRSGVADGPELLDLTTLHDAIEAHWAQLRYDVENEYIGAPPSLGLRDTAPVALATNISHGTGNGFPARPEVVGEQNHWWD
ncbi:hypothetical protein AB0A94_00200 [Streptomyces sp. NPDC044984]|uniref:hypothetical protein n=1 Tax=Streptomyces sp. NPDC044984 TaxID=3154335 RepID=UPI0033C1C0BB